MTTANYTAAPGPYTREAEPRDVTITAVREALMLLDRTDPEILSDLIDEYAECGNESELIATYRQMKRYCAALHVFTDPTPARH